MWYDDYYFFVVAPKLCRILRAVIYDEQKILIEEFMWQIIVLSEFKFVYSGVEIVLET